MSYVQQLDPKVFNRQKERIRKLALKWLNTLGLRHWNIDLRYYAEIVESGPESANRSLFAECFASWKYMDVQVRFNLACAIDMSDEQLERLFIHELMHVLLSEMHQDEPKAQEHEERTATVLANAFMWTYELGVEDGKEIARKRKKNAKSNAHT